MFAEARHRASNIFHIDRGVDRFGGPTGIGPCYRSLPLGDPSRELQPT